MKHLKDGPYQVTMEIINKQCKMIKTLKKSGISQFNIVDIRGFRGGLTRHLVRMPSHQLGKVSDGSFKVKSSSVSKGMTSAWFDSKGCDVCNTILSHDSFLISGSTVQNQSVVYTFIARDFKSYRSIMSALEDSGFQLKVLEIGKLKRVGEILTEKQERALWIALKTGFFDYPKKIRGPELAHRLGIAQSTLSETVRRGVRRLLENHFEKEGTSGKSIARKRI